MRIVNQGDQKIQKNSDRSINQYEYREEFFNQNGIGADHRCAQNVVAGYVYRVVEEQSKK